MGLRYTCGALGGCGLAFGMSVHAPVSSRCRADADPSCRSAVDRYDSSTPTRFRGMRSFPLPFASAMSLPNHGLEFEGTRFHVVHRRRRYGPFDYQWNQDLDGIELLYQGEKFGEYCSVDEIFADLKPAGLPLRVAQVASVVLGCTIYGILNGLDEYERQRFLGERLREFHLDRFLPAD